MREERAGGHRVRERRRDTPPGNRADHRVEADDQEQEHERERHDESDDGRARQSGREDADRRRGACEEEAPQVAAEDGAEVRAAQPCGRADDRERERERDADEGPRGEELADQRLPERAISLVFCA